MYLKYITYAALFEYVAVRKKAKLPPDPALKFVNFNKKNLAESTGVRLVCDKAGNWLMDPIPDLKKIQTDVMGSDLILEQLQNNYNSLMAGISEKEKAITYNEDMVSYIHIFLNLYSALSQLPDFSIDNKDKLTGFVIYNFVTSFGKNDRMLKNKFMFNPQNLDITAETKNILETAKSKTSWNELPSFS